MVGVVKHKDPRSFCNNSPFYLSTNQLPDLGEENDSVYRRTRVSQPKPAITAVEASREDNDAVAYFIVYSQSDVCNQETIFRTFHNEDTEANVDPIKARQRGDGDGLAFRLFNVVKDHNNYFVNETVAVSNGSQRILMSVGSPSFSS